METLARVWAHETASTNIRVNLFNPGPTRTSMRAAVMPGEDPMTLPTPEEVERFVNDEKPNAYDELVERLLASLPDADEVTVILNDVVVNACTKASHTKGKILFQSEAAEVFFRRIDLLPLKK